MTIRLVIADDERLVRAGLRMILRAEPDLEVVGEAENGFEAIEATHTLAPDVVLMDIRMPGLDGLEATRRIKGESAASPSVIVLTTFDLDEYVYQALRAGASGYLLKDAPPEQLVGAVKLATDGAAILAPSVTRKLIESFVPDKPRQPPPKLDALTSRELDVFKLVARGLSNHEIAESLVVSDHTIKTHVAHILQKLGLRDRTQVVVAAYEWGVAQRGDSDTDPAKLGPP